MIRSLLFALFSVLALPGNLFSAPKIQFDAVHQDLGTHVQGDVVRRSFGFRNTGDAALRISKVKASCGCTSASVDRSLIPAGGSGKLLIVFESAKFPGKIKKSVTVFSNDPENPQVVASFAVEVKEAWSVRPSHFTFTASRTGLATEEPFIQFELMNKSTSALRRVSLASPSAEIVFDRTFPVSLAGIRTDSVFRAQVSARLKEKVDETRYSWIDVWAEFEDGRKLEKRIGVSIKKFR